MINVSFCISHLVFVLCFFSSPNFLHCNLRSLACSMKSMRSSTSNVSPQPGLLDIHLFIVPYFILPHLFVVSMRICHLSHILFCNSSVVVKRFSKALCSLNAKPGRKQSPGSLGPCLGDSDSVGGGSLGVPF